MGEKIKIIAHRGASKEAPENTIPAFKRAIEIGVDGIELDVLLTKDRVPIVTHNNDLHILTSHKGNIHKINFSDLKTLDFGSHFDDEFAGTTIPTLTEVIELCQVHPVKLYIELKEQPISGIESIVGGLINDMEFSDRCVVSSFSTKILKNMKKQFPYIRRGLGVVRRYLRWPPMKISIKEVRASEIHLRSVLANSKIVDWANKNDLGISFWTVNEATEMLKIAKLKPEGIITNDPALAKKIIQFN